MTGSHSIVREEVILSETDDTGRLDPEICEAHMLTFPGILQARFEVRKAHAKVRASAKA